MKTIWLASFAILASSVAVAQTTIYKHVDASGRVTYSNKPIKDGTVVELEPLTTIPSTPAGMLQTRKSDGGIVDASVEKNDTKTDIKPAVAVVAARPAKVASAAFASVDTQTQKSRDEGRRTILMEELSREEKSLADIRASLSTEQQNPVLIAAVRQLQAATEPTPAQQMELRQNLEKASGRIRGLQATAAEHEKNIEAIRKELGALKP